MRTFVSDERPYPRRRDDWEGCERKAGELLAERARRYPDLVAQQKLDADAAERGLRVMGAIVKLWGCIVDRQDLPAIVDCEVELGASFAEMQAEITGTRARLGNIARQYPGDSEKRADAEYGHALWWHLQPVAPGALPHIWIAYGYAQHERAKIRQGRAA